MAAVGWGGGVKGDGDGTDTLDSRRRLKDAPTGRGVHR